MYTKYIKQATHSVFSDAFGHDVSEAEKNMRAGRYNSSIKIKTNDDDIDVFFTFNKKTLAKLVQDYMFEDSPDEETIVDFSCEMANLIVGTAKVFANDDNHMIDISTPLVEESYPKKLSKEFTYNFNDMNFKIGVR